MEATKNIELLAMIKDVQNIFDEDCECIECNKSQDCDCCMATALYKAGYRKVSDTSFTVEYIITKEHTDGGVLFRDELLRTSSRENAVKKLALYSKIPGYTFKIYWRFVSELVEVINKAEKHSEVHDVRR